MTRIDSSIQQAVLTAVSLVAAILGLASCATPMESKSNEQHATTSLSAMHFLTGIWRSADATEEGYTEEQWTAEAGRTMFGANRVISNGETVFFEFLRIVADEATGEVIYHAAPRGRYPATPFRMIAHDPGRMATFENPEHDFPQRIVYELDPETGTLAMRIGGERQGQYVESGWSMHRIN